MSISRLAGGSVPRWWCTPSRTWAGGAATLQPRHLLLPLCPLDVSHTFPHRDREKRELRKALTLAVKYWASDAFARTAHVAVSSLREGALATPSAHRVTAGSCPDSSRGLRMASVSHQAPAKGLHGTICQPSQVFRSLFEKRMGHRMILTMSKTDPQRCSE